MTHPSIKAATELIRYAKRTGDDAVSAATAVELACAGLDADQLRSVLRLLWPYMAELYDCFRLCKAADERREAAAFAEIAAMFGDPDTDAEAAN
ncbi:hypothetical protein [Mycobacterium riyadhense]|uniref:hypothetical protein n=1 Tax=Mycobacterium riyadhense TaxID=486698 RepID=UPI0019589FB0|nr:hypothetical protein [Mycobacterium riyadhense]